jgi:alpha-tubulin suppressor-like RCC1 family protein
MSKGRDPLVAFATILAACAGGACTDAPTAVPLTPTPFVSLSADLMHTCGVTADSLAYCWGVDDHGALGAGGFSAATAPLAVLGAHKFLSIATGQWHTCALGADSTVSCWGSGYTGFTDSLGQPAVAPVSLMPGKFRAVATGAVHDCVLTTSGDALCWGRNDFGELGTGDSTGRAGPTAVATSLKFVAIAAGLEFTCAVSTGGAAYCWGSGGASSLGIDSTPTRRLVPVPVSGGLTFTTISASGSHVCALTPTGAAYCWGPNGSGQLGTGDTVTSARPVAVAGGHLFTVISAGSAHTCGLATTGAAWCWGTNWAGQLGVGDAPDQCGTFGCALAPVAVPGNLRFTTVTGGTFHTCGATADWAYCWGLNVDGEFGTGFAGPLSGLARVAAPLPPQ